jgi:uncharacterized protein (DUF2249 family)
MKLLDVRELVCSQRHALIFAAFEELAVGEGFEFVNDHKPTPLYHQFCQRYPNQFNWEYLDEGPDVWRMAIRRVMVGTATVFEGDSSIHIQINTGEINTGENRMKVIDVREITPRDRHPLIFQTLDGLAVDEHFELVNDHDPKPLYYQLLHERPGQFLWEYLEQGPLVWRVTIGRQATQENA